MTDHGLEGVLIGLMFEIPIWNITKEKAETEWWVGGRARRGNMLSTSLIT